jgi:hypothetical protein
MHASQGLKVSDTGSSAHASHCKVSNCSKAAFACEDGLLTTHSCQATENSGYGFCAVCRGNITATKCAARNNNLNGFTVDGGSSLLQLGPGCVSEGNKGCGFMAQLGGHLVAGAGCIAKSNGETGFLSSGKGSHLISGTGCHAISNGDHGFWVRYGGHLAVLNKGEAADNHLSGFASTGEGSVLTAGDECTSYNNGLTGFRAAKGGRMAIANHRPTTTPHLASVPAPALQ